MTLNEEQVEERKKLLTPYENELFQKHVDFIKNGSKIIALDIDSVLADVIPVWCKVFNEKHKAEIDAGKRPPLSKPDIRQWAIHEQHDIDEHEVYNIFHVVWTKHSKEIQPTEPNIDKVVEEIIKKGHRVTILSNRKRFSVAVVAQWLLDNKIPYNDLIFIEDMRPKSDFPFDILIDDGIHNVKELIPEEVTCTCCDPPQKKLGVLMTQPWNMNEDHPYRVASVSEFVRMYL